MGQGPTVFNKNINRSPIIQFCIKVPNQGFDMLFLILNMGPGLTIMMIPEVDFMKSLVHDNHFSKSK